MNDDHPINCSGSALVGRDVYPRGAGVTALRMQTDTGSRPAGVHATAVV